MGNFHRIGDLESIAESERYDIYERFHFACNCNSGSYGGGSRVARPPMPASAQIFVFRHCEHVAGGLGPVRALWRISCPCWKSAGAKLSSEVWTLSGIQSVVLD